MPFFRAILLPMIALPWLITGCAKDDSIQQYTITHEEREPLRLLVAILPHKDLVWFIRLSGPDKQVQENLPAYESFVKSVRFDDKDPPITWEAPKDWTRDPPLAERFAGFRVDAKPRPLEVTVTRFPAEKYSLMSNMHRWQKQINLPLAEEKADLLPFIKEAELANHQPVTWVDMKGLGTHVVSKLPEKTTNPQKFIPPLKTHKGSDLPFKFVLPEGWVEQPPRNMITRSLFVVSEGDKIAETTLTVLKGDGGGLGQNINRWRDAVGLPRLPDEEVARSADPIQIAGIKSFYVDLANPGGPAGKNRTLGVIIPLGQETWFVKMTGAQDWIGQNKNAFENFVKSFRLDAH